MNEHDRIFEDLRRIQARVEALRDGGTLAQAQANLEERFETLLQAFEQLRADFDSAPQRWADTVIAEVKRQGNIRFEPHKRAK